MSEQSQHSEPKKMNRREFLRLAVKTGVSLVGGAVLSDLTLRGNPRASSNEEDSKLQESELTTRIQELITDIKKMSLTELEQQIFNECPVIPHLAQVKEHLQQITDIPKGSILLKAGTSVAWNMLQSIYGTDVNPDQINFGAEQEKLRLVLEYFQLPSWALEQASLLGEDIDQLLHDPLFCSKKPRDVVTSPYSMPCPPNLSVIDAYIDYFHSKVAINFVGTNLMHNEVSLEEFAMKLKDLIQHYLSKNVIPILTTLPHPPNDNSEVYREWYGESKETIFLPENALRYNLLIVKLAELYQVPLINLERGVVELAEHDGTVFLSSMTTQIDPIHFSHTPEKHPLRKPEADKKFQTGEEAVSYFTVLTLYELLKVMGK
ncbi:MAG: hypothetical protein ABI425_04195 [Patescibacteria group bacterium]